jgi:hypothetical protein
MIIGVATARKRTEEEEEEEEEELNNRISNIPVTCYRL